MVQHSWPVKLQHSTLLPDIFLYIPQEAFLQFSKKHNELTQKLMVKESQSFIATKGEEGGSSAQFSSPWMSSKPSNNRSQTRNLMSQNEEQINLEDEPTEDDKPKDTTSNIQAAFNFLPEFYRNQHGCVT